MQVVLYNSMEAVAMLVWLIHSDVRLLVAVSPGRM